MPDEQPVGAGAARPLSLTQSTLPRRSHSCPRSGIRDIHVGSFLPLASRTTKRRPGRLICNYGKPLVFSMIPCILTTMENHGALGVGRKGGDSEGMRSICERKAGGPPALRHSSFPRSTWPQGESGANGVDGGRALLVASWGEWTGATW